jgi:DNA-binding CsgD family transcriptional regulator
MPVPPPLAASTSTRCADKSQSPEAMQDGQRSKLSPKARVSPDVALVRFISALTEATSAQELKRAFVGFGALLSVPMYGFYSLEPGTQRIEHNVGINVSDAFVARYEDAMEFDPLIEASRTNRGAVYNLELMSSEEWRESVIYRRAYAVHSMQHVVEVPILGQGEVLGALHFAASDANRDVASTDLSVAEAIAEVLALSIVRIRRHARDNGELERALVALEITNTAVVWSGPSPVELRQNAAARRLLAEVVDGPRRLYDLLARPPSEGSFSRRGEVELVSGEPGVVHAHSTTMPSGRGLVTVLELQPEQASIRPQALAGLTPREAEIAALVVDGLSDREIAVDLILSHHTVSQHVRAIYRKLGVNSRVGLTRLLIAPPSPTRRN